MIVALVSVCHGADEYPPRPWMKNPRPVPTLVDVAYGEHPRQVLDFYQAESDKPTPLVFYIHGGAWMKNNKNRMHLGLDCRQLLEQGISVVSINYRYLADADNGEIARVRAPLEDAARALQFVRHKAKDWNIDASRIGACGQSAGAFSALWLAFHDDLADPSSEDPVARESTRVSCVAVVGAQTTLDPKLVREWIPNAFYGGHAFGFRYMDFDGFLAEREALLPLIRKYSPYELLSEDDPPVWLLYRHPPALGEEQEDPTHSANYGITLQARCAELKVPCKLVHPEVPDVQQQMAEAFLIDMLREAEKNYSQSTDLCRSASAAGAPLGVQESKMNILLILLDDVGYCDIGAFAAPINNTSVENLFYETPHMDQFAKSATMFTQFYANTVCTPSRASLLTGKMSHRMGLWDAYARVDSTYERQGKPVPDGGHILDYQPPSKFPVAQRGVTVPRAATVMRDVKIIPQSLPGYHTAFIGKWHLGSHNHSGYQPKDHGFQEVMAYFDGGGSSYHRPFKAVASKQSRWEHPGPKLMPEQDYLCDDIAQRVNRFLERQVQAAAEKPFFLYLAHPAAHGPIQSRADDLAHFKSKRGQPGLVGGKDAKYAGLIKGMDRSIGAILDKLDTLGLAENTAVILVSDNGGHPIYTRNSPLRGGKSMLYEGGIRVPMIVRWPGKTQAGAVCDIPAEITDIYPTVLEIAGVDSSGFYADSTNDGKSLLPLLEDPQNSDGAYTRTEFYQFYGKMGYKKFHKFASWAILRKGDYKLHYDYQGKVELYNIADDLIEKNNLVEAMPERALAMLVQLTDWLEANCHATYLPQPNPDFEPGGPMKYGPYIPLEELKQSLRAIRPSPVGKL